MPEASALIPSCECFHPRFEPCQCLWSDFPSFGALPPGKAEPEETSLPGSVDSTLTPVHLQLQALRDEATDACQHTRPGSGTPHVDIAIIGVPTEPMASVLEFLVQLIQHHVGKER